MAMFIKFILLLIATTFSQTTAEPTRVNCNDDLWADILIAVDTSCYMSVSECLEQQTLVSQVFTALRGSTTHIHYGRSIFKQRIAYVEFGSDSALNKPFDEKDFCLFLDSYNYATSSQPIYSASRAAAITTEYYEAIRDRSDIICNNDTRVGNPNLHGLLTDALTGLFSIGNSDNMGHNKYILIFSNCGVIDAETSSVCNEFEGVISPSHPAYLNVPYMVNMINLRPSFQNPTDPYYIAQPNKYISCLVQCDNDKKIFVDSLPNIDMETIIDGIQNMVCDTGALRDLITTCPPTTTSEPTTTQSTTFESTDDTTTSQIAECPEDKLGDECDYNDENCPPCMRCCRGRNICEYREDYVPPVPAKAVLYTPKDNTPITPGIKHIDNHNHKSYFNVIGIVGFVLFILINNIFVCYWCVCKDNYQKLYQHVDKVEEFEI